MWRSRVAGLVVGIIALGISLAVLYRLFYPATDPLPPDEARRVAYDRLSALALPPWDPGGELSPTALPEPLPTPAPNPWPGQHPADVFLPAEERERVNGSLLQLGENPMAAAGGLSRVVKRRPSAWALRYNLGVSLLRAGLWDDAVEHLDEALQRLLTLQERYGSRPEHRAATVHNRYALGQALLKHGQCVRAIRTAKLGIRALSQYLEVSDLEIYGRYLPFTVAPTSLDSYSMWLLLAQAYAECEGRYPAEYFANFTEAKDFRTAEYSDPEAAEVRDGPFPNELAACIADNGSTSRCWALSNLNQIYFASRQAYPEREGEAPTGIEPLWPRMAAIAYEIARLAVEREHDRSRAARYLQQARILNRSNTRAGLGQRIDQLGRYLAREVRDFTLLADPYRGTAIEALPFARAALPEEVKGMAWVLKETCERHLSQRNPEAIQADIAKARQTLAASEYLASLDHWQGQVERALQDRLLTSMATERQRPDLATATAIREFRAGFLGASWPRRATLAWINQGLITSTLVLLMFILLSITGWWLIHRYVVYPYLLYTRDYYKTEFLRRHKSRRKADRPFTGEEIQEFLEARGPF